MKSLRRIVICCLLLSGCSPQVTILVPDMMCEEGCAAKVHEILSEQPGVKRVVVDFEAKTATVTVGKDKSNGHFDVDAAVSALVDHGFEDSTLKSDGKVDGSAAETTDQPAS